MSHKSVYQLYERKIGQLKRRRDFLDKRIIDYTGKDNSYDKAETSAINWAISVIEANYESAISMIERNQEVKS